MAEGNNEMEVVVVKGRGQRLSPWKAEVIYHLVPEVLELSPLSPTPQLTGEQSPC